MRAAAARAARIVHSSDVFAALDAAPTSIHDVFSSVLGDGFHMLDRPKVPMHHSAKKGYFVAMQEAFYAWNPIKLEEAKAALRTDGMTDDDIEVRCSMRAARSCAC